MKKFTLVELLVVVSIIGILAGLILPIVAGSNKRSMVLRAQIDVAALKMAIEKYATDNHGKLPVCHAPFVDDDGKCDDDYMDENGRLTKRGYDVLTQLLSGVDIEYDSTKDNLFDDDDEKANDTTKHSSWVKVNPRKVAYLDVSQDFALNGMRDPWGNRYVIVFDYDNLESTSSNKYPDNSSLSGGETRAALDDKIKHPAIDNDTIENSSDLEKMIKKNLAPVLRVPVAVYSTGPNGDEANDTGDTGGLGSEFNPDFDDINSWSSM